MAIKRKAGSKILGLAADPKPTAAAEPLNTIFHETDTHNEYINNGTTWVLYRGPAKTETLTNKTVSFDTNTFPLIPTSSYYTVYRAGTTTKCRDNLAGTVVSSSATNPEIPIQYAIDNGVGKRVYIANGTYDLSNTFSGFVFDVDQTDMYLLMDPGAELRVPSGYAGSVFLINGGSTIITIDGGKINDGFLQRLYTAFKLESGTASGVNACRFLNTRIRNANKGIHLKTTGITSGTAIGWITGCLFENMFIDRTKTHIEFDQLATSFGCNRNTFSNVACQCESGISDDVSIKNVAGKQNEFYAVKVWDIQSGAKRCTISDLAKDTLIVGGLMTGVAAYYTDLGRRTRVLGDEATRSDNPMVLEMPSVKGVGMLAGINPTGDGILNGVTSAGATNANSISSVDGRYYRYTSGAATGDKAGFRNTNALTYRTWNPYWKQKFRFVTVGNCRMWLGWFGVGTELTGDDASVNSPCYAIGARSTDANFMLIHNDATGATNYTALSTTVVKDTTIRTVELFADDAGARFGYAIDEGDITWRTTEIPATTAALFPHFYVEVGAVAAAKSIDRFYVELRNEK